MCDQREEEEEVEEEEEEEEQGVGIVFDVFVLDPNHIRSAFVFVLVLWVF